MTMMMMIDDDDDDDDYDDDDDDDDESQIIDMTTQLWMQQCIDSDIDINNDRTCLLTFTPWDDHLIDFLIYAR